MVIILLIAVFLNKEDFLEETSYNKALFKKIVGMKQGGYATGQYSLSLDLLFSSQKHGNKKSTDILSPPGSCPRKTPILTFF